MPRFSKSRAFPFLCWIALAASVAPAIFRTARAEGAAPSAAAPVSSPAQPAPRDLLHQLDDAFVSIFEKVAPAVVIIEAEKKPAKDEQDQNFDFYFHSPENGEGGHQHMPDPSVRSEGSGFIFRSDGFIYTNFHVIEDADKIDVKLRDNRHFAARVVGSDQHTDIAVLKIEAANLPVVSLLDSDSVRVGQMCFAIGIPYNLDFSFCRGIVSGKGRGNLTNSDTRPMYEDYIQTDAFINPGNSGGPLFDIDGRVMGMNTLINGLGRGLSFAIPSNMLSNVGSEIIATGHVSHPWLGITVSSIDDPSSTGDRPRGVDSGVFVQTIEANAPAYKSDLRPKDVITTVDGVPVTTAHDLQHEILRKKVGQSVSLNVWRAGKAFNIPVVTDELPADLTKVAEAHFEAKTHPSDATAYGLQFLPPHPGSGQTQPVRDKLSGGAPVAAVLSGSPASRADIRPGDVITSVDGKPVADATACLQILAAHRGATGPLVIFNRNGQKARAILDTAGFDNP
jgi:S1-C subfamily serine protease